MVPTTDVGARRRVLIVEDDADERRMYASRMREIGWDVEEIPSGADALGLASTFNPHAIVTDLRMPELDGVQATHRLRNDPRTRHIPVVVISGFVDRSWEAYGAGCHTFLTKPCLPETLLDILRGIFAQDASPPSGDEHQEMET